MRTLAPFWVQVAPLRMTRTPALPVFEPPPTNVSTVAVWSKLALTVVLATLLTGKLPEMFTLLKPTDRVWVTILLAFRL
jgi:hypothetical protein